jgi:hypothetical protein
VAELRLRTFKIWLVQFRNFPQSPASSATFKSFFLSSGWFEKSFKFFFRTVSFSGRDSSMRFFTSNFFSWIDRIPRPKIGRKLRKWSSQVSDFKKFCDCGIAMSRLRSNVSLKSCGIAIAEVLPSSCRIRIADSEKSCACPPLVTSNCYGTVTAKNR